MSFTIKNVISSANVPQWGNAKKYIAIHYLGVVGQNYDLQPDGSGAHFTIYWDGTIYQRCDLDAVVWAVGTAGYYTQKHPEARNANTISIEMCCKCDGDSSNAEDKKWYFTEETQQACVWLVQKLMKEHGIPAENVLRHYDIVNKTCPAPYVHNNKYKTSWTWDEFITKVKSVAQDPKTDKIWMGWLKRESGSDGFRQTNGDNGNAYGKYQFDRRYSLVPFMQFCRVYNTDHYGGFEKYIGYGIGSDNLKSNTDLAALWSSLCDRYPEEFEKLQDVFGYQYYYLEAVKYIRNLYGIDMNNHSPAVKGTLYSMAIRSGQLTGAEKFAGCTDKTSDKTMINTAYPTYGAADDSRWTKAGQWGDALEALESGEYTEVPVEMSAVLTISKDHLYRVRLRWGSDMTTQIGAFENLDLAKNRANEGGQGYKVFDENGVIVYDTGTLTPERQRKIALKWCEDTAADDSHGYDNDKKKRGGPDYACSSFCNEGFRQAAVDLPESSTVYTANMYELYLKSGFVDVTDQVNLKTGKGLEAGDIVLIPGKHVEIADGQGNLIGARINELGTMTGGQTGDQTGGEISKSKFWDYSWKYALRYQPSSIPVSTMYFVQVGLYSLRENAEKKVAELQAAGFDAIVKLVGNQFRAQAGAFVEKARAQTRQNELAAAGFPAILKIE